MITTAKPSLRTRVRVFSLITCLSSCCVVCLAQSGSKLWEATIGTGVRVAPAIGADGTIFATCGSSDPTIGAANTRTLYAISPIGMTNWTFVAGATIKSAPAVGVDGTVYFGAANGLYALSSVGVTNWLVPLANVLCSSPAIGADGTIYIVTRTNVPIVTSKLHAISPGGTVNWSCTIGGGSLAGGAAQFPSPSIGPDSSIYVSSLSGQLYSISYSGSTN